MNSVMRLYVMTSRGNHMALRKELQEMGFCVRFDEYLHSFYLDGTMRTLFDLSFHSRVSENVYVQIGKPFSALADHVIVDEFERMQFKNYLPMQRGLIDRLTLSLIIRESAEVPSENILNVLLRQALDGEIVRKEYFQQIINPQRTKARRDRSLSPYEIREIVQRKWAEEDLRQQLFIQTNSSPQLTANTPIAISAVNNQLISNNALTRIQKIDKNVQIDRNLIYQPNKTPVLSNQGIIKDLPYNPQLLFYIRKNKGRMLLKANEIPMYKHGWKKSVGWGPMRESLAASILQKTTLLNNQQQDIVLWDPFCGSGTIPLVAASTFFKVPVRTDYKTIFNWHHWSIFKEQYLEQYFRTCTPQRKNQLRLIASDSNSQALFYTLNNIKSFLNQGPIVQSNPSVQQISHSVPQSKQQQIHYKEISTKQTQQQQLLSTKINGLLRKKYLSQQVYELNENMVCICDDFEEAFAKIGSRVNIVTNLPYTKARSKQTTPLNQLVSAYRRFNKMVNSNHPRFQNVFVVINNEKDALRDPYHFLRLCGESWVKVCDFQNGGIPIGLYAWRMNKIRIEEDRHLEEYKAVVESKRKIEHDLSNEQVGKYLVEYREKVKELEKKWYNVPQHLKRTRRGWKRVIEKRRVRHLQAAYDVFSRRRDQMIAFSAYAHKRLELTLMRRGLAWKKKNMQILAARSINTFEPELKLLFQTTIKDAVVRKETHDSRIQLKKATRAKLIAEMQKKRKLQDKKLTQKKRGLKQRKQDQLNKSKKIKTSTRTKKQITRARSNKVAQEFRKW